MTLLAEPVRTVPGAETAGAETDGGVASRAEAPSLLTCECGQSLDAMTRQHCPRCGRPVRH